MAGANCRGAELDLEEKMEHFNLRFLVSQEIVLQDPYLQLHHNFMKKYLSSFLLKLERKDGLINHLC